MSFETLFFLYLLSIPVTGLCLIAAIWARAHYRRRAIEYADLSSRLPEACRYEDLRSRVIDEEARYEEVRSERAEAERIVEEAERQRQWLEENRDQLLALEAERREQEQIRAELASQQEELARLTSDRDSARDHAERLRFEAERLEHRHKQLEDEVTDLIQRRDTAQAETQKLLSQLTELQKQEAKLETRSTKLSEEVARLSEELKRLEASQKKLWEQESEQASRLTAAREEHASLRQKCKGLESSREQLEQTIDFLRKEHRQRDPGAHQEGIDLFTPSLHADAFEKAMRKPDELECLANVRRYLEARGLRFHERVVNALHTAFKIGLESPLTVLAGISGTGKSLLPRCYAEAMGLHFMNVAVQPRWDGPQDLLGFYNYMERRFVPTELSRGLLQMDAFFPQEWDAPDAFVSLSDRMVLVLLDEMNLARVEYYFSEFLSRLELRRDIDAGRAEDRSRSSVTLERATAEGVDVPLFVGQNVLFVGTMNEDESTQSLSDKVVDRATSLRFGPPPRLRAEEDEGHETSSAKPEALRANRFLPFTAWKSWLSERQLDPAATSEVDRYVDAFNDVLSTIGRPFGYRTRNAIHAYVQQYPRQGEDGLRWALADQIEQRLLPKLRGLDPAELVAENAIRRAGQLAQELGDDALSQTIEAGLRSEFDSYFTWLGVERVPDDVETVA